MAKSWLVDSKGIAKKVRHATLPSAVKIEDCGAKRECPKCKYLIDNSDVSHEWPGLPAGVKFDPSDPQLLEHLAAKCGVGEANSHVLIDEFIPTLEMEQGICYTHPKNLPGATKDGTSVHFFHKTSNAYSSGQRKRRRIHIDENQENVRWHKTGKTKAVFDNGVHKGCKKIMVLYSGSCKGSKSVKSNWVMHQYHLGKEDDESDGEYVVSKIFYQQQKQTETNDSIVAAVEDSIALGTPYCPKTPKIVKPNPPNQTTNLSYAVKEDSMLTAVEDTTQAKTEDCYPPCSSQYKGDSKPSECLAGESQAGEDPCQNDNYDSLLCNEIFSPCAPFDDSISLNDLGYNDYSGCYGTSDLDNIRLDPIPEFQLTNLQFGSQDGLFDWLDRY